MKLLIKIFEYMIYLVGLFFILMAFSCFGGTPLNSPWDIPEWLKQTICFLIQSIPGVILILFNYFLRKRHKILGIILIAFAVASFFFFDFYENLRQYWLPILIIFFPTLTSGILLLVDGIKNQSNNR